MSIPSLDSYLPDLMPFISGLVYEYESGTLDSWASAEARVRAFFTADRMAQYDSVASGWIEMASYANQQTLIHVTLVFLSLLMLPAYQSATPDQQRLAEWVVLFHDISKQPKPGLHDWSHGFRSAAMTARALPALGFTQIDWDAEQLEDWATLTASALTPHPHEESPMQDNHQLPAIIDGIHTLFGEGTPAAIILKGVLFHISLSVVKDYPTPMPLSDEEVVQYIDPPTLPVLKIMMLSDNDAWSLFDAETQQRQRDETLEVFERIHHRYFA